MTTALAYSSGVTTLEDAAAQFAAYMVGWQVMLNPAQPVLRTISAVPSATQLQFAGDGVNLAAAGDFYRVFAPPGVMADANGANWGHQHCDVRYGCSVSFGWAGYRYFAPVAGFVADHSGGGFDVHGRQGASINLVGNYHCWNRVYSPYLGRWTTPDPLASPWWNLWDYCGNQLLLEIDSTGLGRHIRILAKGTNTKGLSEMAKSADCEASSPADFVKCLQDAYDQCVKDGGTASDCCFNSIVHDGHNSAGFGGDKKILTASEQSTIASLLCAGASIQSVQCFGGMIGWERSDQIFDSWVKIIAVKGGMYQGYTGQFYCRGFHNTDKIGEYFDMDIAKGTTKEGLAKTHEKENLEASNRWIREALKRGYIPNNESIQYWKDRLKENEERLKEIAEGVKSKEKKDEPPLLKDK